MHFHTANACISKIRVQEVELRDLRESLSNRHCSEVTLRHVQSAIDTLKYAREQIVAEEYEY